MSEEIKNIDTEAAEAAAASSSRSGCTLQHRLTEEDLTEARKRVETDHISVICVLKEKYADSATIKMLRLIIKILKWLSSLLPIEVKFCQDV